MRLLLAALATLTLSAAAAAQTPTPAASPGATPAATNTISAADKFDAERIPRNSKVFIGNFYTEGDNDNRGFQSYLAAALRKKEVPLLIVTNREEADFEISGTSERKKAGWAKTIFGSGLDSASASITVTNLHTGVVAYADSSHRNDAARGQRSTAEKLAKYLKKKIEDDEKKSAKLGAR